MRVSLLCPSRNRIDLLKKSLKSLDKGEGKFEVLVCIDLDEPQAEQYQELAEQGLIRLFKDKRHGYGGLHNYYNAMSVLAKGDWLMLWNDDAIMQSKNWISRISKYDHTKPMVLNVWNENGDNLFPLISRKWYEIVGHFSQSAHADSWVQQIGQRLGIQVYVPGITIKHEGENLHDETHNEVRQVVRESSAKHRSMERERIQDADKIKEWMEHHANS